MSEHPGPWERPPGTAALIIARLMPAADRDYVLGDLEERYREILASRGRLPARRWYWRQVLRAVAPARRLLALADAGRHLVGSFQVDARTAMRGIAARPGRAVTCALILGVGMGMSGAAFGILNATVLRGLPFPDPDALVHMERVDLAQTGRLTAVTPHDYADWREAQRSFEDLGAYVEATAILAPAGEPPQRLVGVAMSASAFHLLRARAAVGRTFVEHDEAPGAEPVVLLSHRLWISRWGGVPVVGTQVLLSGVATTVIGVMPQGFGFPIAEEFWIPLRLDFTAMTRGQGRLDVFGRLRPGASLQSARADFESIGQRLEEQFPETNSDLRPQLKTFVDEYVGEAFVATTRTLMGASLIMLAICCANVANLLLADGARRHHELAIRCALGASRGRVVRPLLLEAAAMSVAGTLVAAGVAILGMRWFQSAGAAAGALALPHGSDSLFWWRLGLDHETIGYLIGAALIATAACAVAPASRVLRDVDRSLREGSRRTTSQGVGRSSRVLMSVEVLLTTVLLVAAALVVQSQMALTRDAVPIRGDTVVVASFDLPPQADDANPGTLESDLQFADTLVEALRAEPLLADAAVISEAPGRRPRLSAFEIAGRPLPPSGEQPVAGILSASPGALQLLGVEVLDGVMLASEHGPAGDPVALVTSTFARLHLADRAPVGAMLRLGGDGVEPWLRVIGVVPDLWIDARDRNRRAGIVLPLRQSATSNAAARLGSTRLRSPVLLARGESRAIDVARIVRDRAFALDPRVPIREMQMLPEVVSQGTGRYRVWGVFYLAFAAVAVVLASIGVYGVVATHVSFRRAEIGIRAALGATRGRVQADVVRGALGPVAIGLAAGLTLGTRTTAALERVLYDFGPRPIATDLAIGVLVVLVAVAASWIPARAAARIDPATALRAR